MNYTFERDDGLVRSWIDHVFCSKYLSPLVSDIHVSHTVSDHYPLFFHFDIQYSSLSLQSSHTSACNNIHRIDWSKVSPDNIHVYRSMVRSKLLEFPADVFLCFDSHCSVHSDQLDFFADHVVSVLVNCAVACFPSRISSSKNFVGCASKLRKDSIFGKESGRRQVAHVLVFCPRLKNPPKRDSNTKLLRRRKHHLLRNQFAHSFAKKHKDSFWLAVKRLKNTGSTSTAPVVGGIHGVIYHIANMFASKFRSLLMGKVLFLMIGLRRLSKMFCLIVI